MTSQIKGSAMIYVFIFVVFSFAGCSKQIVDETVKSVEYKNKSNVSDVGLDGTIQEDGSGVYFSPTRGVIADNFKTSQNGNIKIEVKIWSDQTSGEHSNYLEVPVDNDFVIIGGGARITSMDNKVPNYDINALLTASFPVDDNMFNKYAAASKDHEVPYAHRLTVYAIGLKVYYFSAAAGDYVPFPSSVIKSQMYMSHVSTPFQNGVSFKAYAPPVSDPLLYFTLCGGGKLSWPQGQSGLLLTDIILSSNSQYGGFRAKDHAITTLGGTAESFCLYFRNQNPLNTSEHLIDINYGLNNYTFADITDHHQTLVGYTYNGGISMASGFLLCSLTGGTGYTGFGRMLYALYPLDGFTGVVSSKDHLESDISHEMYIGLIGIKPAN